MNVRDGMTNVVLTVGPAHTLREASRQMSARHVGAAVVGYLPERSLMVLGIDEACTNVIRYAYRLRDDQLISLRMEGLRKCVRMRLRDYGEQVFPHEMKGRSHDLIKPGGLGLHLIRTAFDQVNYIHKRRGTELVLTKNLEC